MQNNKEKELTPSANDASSEKNYPTNNDTAQSEICQEEITVPKELSKDLFQLMFDCIQNMAIACTIHGLHDAEIVGRVIRATIVTSSKVFFEHEEDKHDRH